MGDKPTLSRRGLIGAAAGTAAASALTPWSASAHGRHRHQHERSRLLPKSRIGIQLYTVRDQVDTLGFDRGVQAAGGDRLQGGRVRGLQRPGPALEQPGAARAAAQVRPLSRGQPRRLRDVPHGSRAGARRRRGDRHEVRRHGVEPGRGQQPDRRRLQAGRRGLQHVRRRGAQARAALLPAQPRQRVRGRGRHAAVRRAVRGDRPAARVPGDGHLLGVRRPEPVPGLPAQRLCLGQPGALPALPRQGRAASTAARTRAGR